MLSDYFQLWIALIWNLVHISVPYSLIYLYGERVRWGRFIPFDLMVFCVYHTRCQQQTDIFFNQSVDLYKMCFWHYLVISCSETNWETNWCIMLDCVEQAVGIFGTYRLEQWCKNKVNEWLYGQNGKQMLPLYFYWSSKTRAYKGRKEGRKQ